LLAIIVILGVLMATAIIGVNAMSGTDTVGVVPTSTSAARVGGDDGAHVGLGAPVAAAAAAACKATATAATAASSVYFASHNGTYPTTWSDLTASSSFALPDHVAINPTNPQELDGNGWKLNMSGSGTTAPTFACA
jgi:hypothetical protein